MPLNFDQMLGIPAIAVNSTVGGHFLGILTSRIGERLFLKGKQRMESKMPSMKYVVSE